MDKLGIVVTTVKGGESALKALFTSIAASAKDSSIILVDDGGNGEEFSLAPLVTYVSTGNRVSGYSEAANVGEKAMNGEKYVLFVHDDIEIPDGADFCTMVQKMEDNPKIGIISGMLIKPRMTIGDAYFSFVETQGNQILKKEYQDWFPEYPRANEEKMVDLVRSGLMMVRRDIFQQVGGFSEEFFPGFFADFDLCLKVKEAGYEVLYMPSIKVYHNEGYTMLDPEFDIKPEVGHQMGLEKFKEKWLGKTKDSSIISWRRE